MKQLVLILLAFGSLVWFLPAGYADDAATAAAIADRQNAEERYRRLNTTLEDLNNSYITMRKRLNALEEEVKQLRAELARANQNKATYATMEDVTRLVEKVHQELDRKREEDKELILREIKKLAKAPVIREPTSSHTSQNAAPKPEKEGYFEYEIKPGDILSQIVTDLRKAKLKVTIDQIKKANPGLNIDVLPVGKKIIIPDSTAKE